MYAWEGIQKALDYIEEHCGEDLEIETLAGTAALSPYYFQRLFARLVRKPVSEYIKLRRLARAAEELKVKDNRIIDIAMDCGFADHAGFTKAFKAAYGVTPAEYRRRPLILSRFLKPDLGLDMISVDEGVPVITEGIVVEVIRRRLEKPRMFIGVEGSVPVRELSAGRYTGIAAGGVIWDTFHSRKEEILSLLPGGNEIGVLHPGSYGEGYCTYMAGAEVSENTGTEGYVSYTLPAGEYIVCCFEGENFKQLIESAVYRASSFMNGWMKKHGFTCGDFTAELYYGSDPEASYMELWMPFHEITKITERENNWNKTDGTKEPSPEIMAAYVNNPLWGQLCEHAEQQYQTKPIIEYSRCSMQPGWNLKYRKAGRTLCTLYPMAGYFTVLIVIGERERTETEFALPSFTDYVRRLYRETRTGMGQKWLMIDVTEEAVLEDVKQCIAIRRGKRSGIIT